MLNLTIKSVSNNRKSKSGNDGSFVFFNETHKDGEYKGKNLSFWIPDRNYVISSKKGWILDDEGRIIEPINTKEDAEERKFILAQKYGVTLSI